MCRPLADPYWRELGYVSDEDRFSTPALMINTWHDQKVGDTPLLPELMKRNADSIAPPNVHVIIGPGNHCNAWETAQSRMVGDLPAGKNAAQPYGAWYTAMFDYWLRGQSAHRPSLPPYRF